MVIATLCLLFPFVQSEAQDHALSFHVQAIEVSPDGKVTANCILKYNKANAGHVLSWFCPSTISVPSYSLPWSWENKDQLRIEGIPKEFLAAERFEYNITTAVRPSIVLQDGRSVSGTLDLTRLFKEDFFKEYCNPKHTLKMRIVVNVDYLNEAIGFSADRLPTHLRWFAVSDFTGFSHRPAFRTVSLKSDEVEVVNISPENPNSH